MNRAFREKVCLVGVLAALAVLVSACGGAPNAKGMAPQGGEESQAVVLNLSMAYPRRETITLTSEIIGTVKPKNQADVLPKMSGEVLAVHFQAGDRVTEGQTLVTLDSDNLVSARIAVDNAQLQLTTAEKNLERVQALFDSGAQSQQSLEQAQQAVDQARLQLESAQDSRNTLEKNVYITAPISGIVESRNVEVHDTVSPQSPICTIAQKDTMQIIFQVSERIKNTLRLNDRITLTKNGSEYSGTIVEIADKTDGSSGLFEIKADIENAQGLSSGSKAALYLVTDRAENVLTIPVDAVYYDDGQPYVFINQDGMAAIRYIEAGIYNEQLMQVISGLDENTEVITSWSSKLAEGAAVIKAGQEG